MFDTYILPVLIFAGIGLLAGTLHVELQLPVEDGWRGVFGRMGRDVRDFIDGHRALRQSCLGDI